MKKNEYGVACLLTESSIKFLRENFLFLDKRNIPHISLFQFRCTDANFLCQIQKLISKIEISQSYNSKGISQFESNIFLDINDDSTLKNGSDILADFYATTCHKKELLSQVNLDCLNKENRALVEQYGIYWIKENFNPHITLTYNKSIKDLNKINILDVLHITPPKLYNIDHFGRIYFPQQNCGSKKKGINF